MIGRNPPAEPGYATDNSKAPGFFRSRGEARIAQCLDRENIPYHYEQPVAVMDKGKTRIWYPDFYLRQYGILVEYFGCIADPVYRAGMIKKQTVYAASGLDCLSWTPQDFYGDWPNLLLNRIECILEDRLVRFQTNRGKLAPR